MQIAALQTVTCPDDITLIKEMIESLGPLSSKGTNANSPPPHLLLDLLRRRILASLLGLAPLLEKPRKAILLHQLDDLRLRFVKHGGFELGRVKGHLDQLLLQLAREVDLRGRRLCHEARDEPPPL